MRRVVLGLAAVGDERTSGARGVSRAVLEFGEFRRFMTDCLRVGGGVTVNVGVTPEGRLNTESLAYQKRLPK